MKISQIPDEQLPDLNPITKYLTADWTQASQHGLASKIGTIHESDLEYCKCCFHHIHKQPIPMSHDTKQLEFLGFGVPLYFAFVRNCIFLLLVMLCSYNIPSLYYALTENKYFCQTNLDNASEEIHANPQNITQLHMQIRKNYLHINSKNNITTQQQIQHRIECTGWMIHFSRIRNQVTIDEQLIRFGSFMIHFILLVYIRDKLTKMKYYFDQRSASPSDFAVFVKNLPLVRKQREAILNVLKEDYGINGTMDVILVPEMQDFQMLGYRQQILIEEMQQKAKKNQNYSQESKQILKLQSERNNQIRKKQKLYELDQLEAERALILFNSQDQKWQLINKYQNQSLKRKGWQKVKMSQASQPDQIIWENTFLKGTDKSFFKFLGWLMSILTLILTTAIFTVLFYFKSQLVEHKIQQYQRKKGEGLDESGLLNQAFGMVLGMIFLVVLFNKFVLAHLFHKFTQIQRHSNTYKFQFYFCLKYCLGLFFTTALMTIIIQDFIFNNYFKHNFGVVEQQTIMFLFNSIFVPLFWLINPMYLVKLLKRKRKYGQKFLTQNQANQIMSDPTYDVGKRYGEVLQIMWFTFLYMSIIPIGGMFSCVGLIAYYWVDKYNLLNRSSIHGLVSGDLINLTLNMLEFTLVLRVLGQMEFDYQLRGAIPIETWAYLTISICYVIMPAQVIVNFINHQVFLNQRLTYKEAEKFFKNTYYNVHILFNHLHEDRLRIYQQKINKRKVKDVVLKQNYQDYDRNKEVVKITNKK